MQIQTVPTLSIIAMIFTALIAIGVPITLIVVTRKKTKARISSFFIGCITFIVFALVLESIMHGFILSGTGNVITGNYLLYALYGGIAASVFEETGRYLAMRFCMKRTLDRGNAVMYGIGHGGVEAIILIGITYIANIIMSFLANAGVMETTLGALDNATRQQTLTQISALWTTSSGIFFLAGVERLSAITLHIALSVFVYKTVKTGNVRYLAYAYVIHFAIDAGTLLLAKVVSTIWMEVIVMAAVIIVAYFAVQLYKEDAVKEEAEPQI